jgi:hypothetical protein
VDYSSNVTKVIRFSVVKGRKCKKAQILGQLRIGVDGNSEIEKWWEEVHDGAVDRGWIYYVRHE